MAAKDSEIPPKDMTAVHRTDDYEYGRELLYHASEQMQRLLGISVDLANEAQHPRAIEVAKDTAVELASMAQKMMKHHEQQQKITGEKAVAKSVTNNNLNLKMSSKDLLELLRRDE